MPIAFVAAALLAAAGIAKLRSPDPTGQALRMAGLPDGPSAVRALGAGEVVVGLAALLGVPGAMGVVALAYVGFTVFVVRQLRDPAASCGCFGDTEAPLTRLHAVVDVVLAVAAGAATSAAPSLVDVVIDDGVVLGLTATGLVAVATLLVRVLLVDLPTLADRITLVADA